MSKNLSAVVLASRTHRHLKTPVPLLPFGESTVLARTLTAYLGAGFEEVLVVLGYKATEVEASLQSLAGKIRIVASPLPDEDFAGLVRRGMEQLPSSCKAFALGIGNQPLLEPALVKELASVMASKKPKILVPVWQGQLGYPSFFDASLAPEFKALPPHGEAWDVVKKHGSEVLDYEVHQTSVVRYIEDMEDYQALLTLAGLPVPTNADQEFGSELSA